MSQPVVNWVKVARPLLPQRIGHRAAMLGCIAGLLVVASPFCCAELSPILAGEHTIINVAQGSCQDLAAQTEDTEDEDTEDVVQLSKPATFQVEIGMTVSANQGSAKNVVAVTVYPVEWDEQKLTILSSEKPPGCRVKIKAVTDGGSQMVVTIPRLRRGQSVTVKTILEVTRFHQRVGDRIRSLQLPPSPIAKVRTYLRPSPGIESSHPLVKKTAESISEGITSDLSRVQAIHEWTQLNVAYRAGAFKGCLKAIEDGFGDCEELSSVFIALCRASGIPARSVWVPGHCYSEFCMENSKGEVVWIPVESVGNQPIGTLRRHDVILQKGDRFRTSQRRGESLRYLNSWLKASGPVSVEFIQKISTAVPATEPPAVSK